MSEVLLVFPGSSSRWILVILMGFFPFSITSPPVPIGWSYWVIWTLLLMSG